MTLTDEGQTEEGGMHDQMCHFALMSRLPTLSTYHTDTVFLDPFRTVYNCNTVLLIACVCIPVLEGNIQAIQSFSC